MIGWWRPMHDCLIVGAGAIGLSLAYELACTGWSVRVVERGEPGRESSWAGAGIFPPANQATAVHPLDQLRGLSHRLHIDWSTRLREETGIDNEYQRCGGLYLARDLGEAATLRAFAKEMRELQIEVREVPLTELANLEPALRDVSESGRLRSAWLLPDEVQLRNPRHLQALLAACRQRGVDIEGQTEVVDFPYEAGQLQGVQTNRGLLTAKRYCLTSGAWTYGLLKRLGIETGIFPVRGQIVLFHTERPILHHVISEGSRYLVPRRDGRLLVGSTEEEAGYDKRTTEAAIADLTDFAWGLVPALQTAAVEQTWAGLRPATFDGFPYLGRIPGLNNAYVAAGHFRSGLHLSTGTAVVMRQLMCGEQPEIDLSPFRVGRG